MAAMNERDETGSAPAVAGGDDANRPKANGWVWLAPLCFALSPLISLYAANIGEVTPRDLLRPAAALLGGTLVLGLILSALLRNGPKAAVTLSSGLFLFFSYGLFLSMERDVLDLFSFFSPDVRSKNVNLFILPIWAALFLTLMVLCIRTRRDFKPAASILVVVGCALVSVPAATIVRHGANLRGGAAGGGIGGRAETPGTADNKAVDPVAPGGATGGGPDIYYIVLDAYGRQDTLREFYGYDNEPFLRELEKRGFYIARRGRANYCQTALCLASSLNMGYLDEVARRAGKTYRDLSEATARIDNNAVAAFLRARGYKFVYITTGTPLTHAGSADLILGERARKPGLNVFERLLSDTTPLAAVPRAEVSLYDEHRAYIQGAFEHLSGVPRLPYPKFVFAHILAPHAPFVLGARGEPLTPDRPFSLADASDFMRRSTRDEYRRGYIDQLRYVNTRVLRAIDDIYARSARRPIIIVQGDHGSRMLLDWQDVRKTNLREAFANLNAYSLPDHDAARFLYQDISPVNSFRLLLNRYFGADYKALPDRSYYSTLYRPYDFIDVTGEASARR
uniref:Sulfatase N-terminal domain-containing protein n=1 Tax=uncultured Armatimonadetes bacterium TaxID=157466 RepID=A0A6J4HAI1_9BACT|nr:hypothetical protein AVDCRST_MAG63-562 [uncultured Armatimonadetes bacterium]